MKNTRFYHRWVKDNELTSSSVRLKETDLFIRTEYDLADVAFLALKDVRKVIEDYIDGHSSFLTSLEPLPNDVEAHPIIQSMYVAGKVAGVGPMASVAGAVSEYVGQRLLEYSREVIVENGGDIFLATNTERSIGIYAGKSRFTNSFYIQIDPQKTPLGICTSSGTVGPSLSFGKADAAIVVAKSSILADALATRLGNIVREEEDIPQAIESLKGINGLEGIIIIKGDRMGINGDLKLIPRSNS